MVEEMCKSITCLSAYSFSYAAYVKLFSRNVSYLDTLCNFILWKNIEMVIPRHVYEPVFCIMLSLIEAIANNKLAAHAT